MKKKNEQNDNDKSEIMISRTDNQKNHRHK